MNPFLGEPFAEVSSASPGDVDAAVNAADAAWESWRRVSGAHRGELLYELADVLTREQDRLARIETQDNGKIIRETRNQLLFVARCYRVFAGAADKLAGETKPLDRESLFDYTTLEPLGVCALITAVELATPAARQQAGAGARRGQYRRREALQAYVGEHAGVRIAR